MVHLGDITKMSGYTIPPVDVITFGSPCQDLSIAGKRAGMAGERSGLLSEAVRIIREMRYATFGAYPKYAVWENVPGVRPVSRRNSAGGMAAHADRYMTSAPCLFMGAVFVNVTQ